MLKHYTCTIQVPHEGHACMALTCNGGEGGLHKARLCSAAPSEEVIHGHLVQGGASGHLRRQEATVNAFNAPPLQALLTSEGQAEARAAISHLPEAAYCRGTLTPGLS